MFFISRCFPGNKYGVVDTDDWSEDIVTWAELNVAVLTHGIRIYGAEVESPDDPDAIFIKFVTPYQHSRFYTNKQAKTKTLIGIDVGTYGDEITYIVADGQVTKDGTRIRPSEFGKRMGWYASVWWKNRQVSKKYVIVLDDGIEMIGETPPEIFTSGVLWDISQVTNEAVIRSVYSELMSDDLLDIDEWSQYVIDKERRVRFWQCYSLIYKGVDTDDKRLAALKAAPDWKENCFRLAKMCKHEFELIADLPIDVKLFPSSYFGDVVRMVNYIVEEGGKKYFSVGDYEFLRKYFLDIFEYLREYANMQYYGESLKFEDYVRCFDAPTDIKRIYVKLCNNVVKAVLRNQR